MSNREISPEVRQLWNQVVMGVLQNKPQAETDQAFHQLSVLKSQQIIANIQNQPPQDSSK